MSVAILDLQKKLGHAIIFARAHPEMIKFFGHYEPAEINRRVPILTQEVLANLLGKKSTASLSGNKNDKKIVDSKSGKFIKSGNIIDPPEGAMVDLAIWLGFGPTKSQMNDLVDTFKRAHKTKSKVNILKSAFDILETWDDESPNRHVWKAFVANTKFSCDGTEYFPPLTDKLRGCAIDDFKTIFDLYKADLKPRIPEFLYGFPDHPDAITHLVKQQLITKIVPDDDLALMGPGIDSKSDIVAFNGAQTQLWLPENAHLRRVLSEPDERNFPLLLKSFLSVPPQPERGSFSNLQKFPLFQSQRDPKFHVATIPLEYTSFGVTVKRESATAVLEKICAQTTPFACFTLLAREKIGKTFAASQVIFDLCQMPDTFTLWCLDDAGQWLNDLPNSVIGELLDFFKHYHIDIQKLVMVVDEITTYDSNQRVEFRNLIRQCESASEQRKIQISVVVTTNDPESVINTDNLVNLELTAADRSRVYDLMARQEPKVIEEARRGLIALEVEVGKSIVYGNDIVAYISYLIEHCGRFESESSDREYLISEHASIKCIIAVPQILAIPVPKKLAEKLFRICAGASFKDAVELQNKYGIKSASSDETGEGYVLSSPFRAIELLKSEEKFNDQFISETIN